MARGALPFGDLPDFCRRTRLPRRLVEHLIRAGAMDGWGRPRRQLLWELGPLRYEEKELDLEISVDEVVLPPLSAADAIAWEYEMLGLSLRHPMSLYRPWLDAQGILGSRGVAACADGQRVRVAGLVAVHQAPPTAKGYHLVTLEDEDGLVDIIVRPDVYARDRSALRTAPLLVVEGQVQRRAGVVNVLASRVAALSSV